MSDDKTERLQSALIALRQILRATELSSRGLAKSSGLTPSQLILLQVLDRKGSTTPSSLAKATTLSQATITTLIDKLADKELVQRVKDTEDRRRTWIRLTENGQKTLQSAPWSLQEQFEEKFSQLDDWEKSFLVAALERVASFLDAEEMDAAPVLDAGKITAPAG